MFLNRCSRLAVMIQRKSYFYENYQNKNSIVKIKFPWKLKFQEAVNKANLCIFCNCRYLLSPASQSSSHWAYPIQFPKNLSSRKEGVSHSYFAFPRIILFCSLGFSNRFSGPIPHQLVHRSRAEFLSSFKVIAQQTGQISQSSLKTKFIPKGYSAKFSQRPLPCKHIFQVIHVSFPFSHLAPTVGTLCYF